MKSVLHTVGAIVVALLAYLLIISIVVPIIDIVLAFVGKWFVPARFGGGEEMNNPGLLNSLFRTIAYSAFGTYGALLASSSIFSNHANGKIVAATIGLVAITWAGFLYFLAFKGATGWFETVVILSGATAGAAPPMFVCYGLWREGWR